MKATARPLEQHGETRGGDVDGHQADACATCGQAITRWLRPRRSDQHRSWRHDWSGTEYCYSGVTVDIIPGEES